MIEWRECPEQPDYEVSSTGIIRRAVPTLQGHDLGRVIRQYIGNSGYLEIGLGRKNARKRYLVHRLVLMAFSGDPPTPDHWVAHNDGRRLNNHIANLRWATPKENQADKYIHGTHLWGDKAPWSKISSAQVTDIRTRWAAGGITQKQLGKEFGIAQTQISRIVNLQRWITRGT